MDKKISARRKPGKCPKCGCAKVASILYGLPDFNPQLERQLDEGKFVLGRCCVSDTDPAWQCVECRTYVYKKGGPPVCIVFRCVEAAVEKWSPRIPEDWRSEDGTFCTESAISFPCLGIAPKCSKDKRIRRATCPIAPNHISILVKPSREVHCWHFQSDFSLRLFCPFFVMKIGAIHPAGNSP